jgi:hypothetical protein
MPHIPDHRTHDPELVAAYAAGDATGPELAAAAGLVADCPDCAALHRDLRAIATALPELPPAVRPRDFRLTPEQAASLRPSGWRGVLAAFASPRFRLAAPLGTGLAAAGLAGLLLASPGGLQLPASAATGATAAPVPAAGAAGAEINPQDQPVAQPDVPSAAASEAAASGGAAFAPVRSAAASAKPATVVPGRAPSADATAATRNSTTASTAPSDDAGRVESTGDAFATAPGAAPTAAPAQETPLALIAAGLVIVGVLLVALRLGARLIA